MNTTVIQGVAKVQARIVHAAQPQQVCTAGSAYSVWLLLGVPRQLQQQPPLSQLIKHRKDSLIATITKLTHTLVSTYNNHTWSIATNTHTHTSIHTGTEQHAHMNTTVYKVGDMAADQTS